MHQILLAVKPRLMRETLKRSLSESPNTVIVGEIDDELDLLLAIRATDANIVIHSWPNSNMPPIYTHLLGEFPGLKLVGLLPDGEQAMLCELRLSLSLVVASSVSELVASLPPVSTTPAKVSLS